jgi:acyl-CoA synthetase (AMP-forming)/AMP-acid ligase II
VKGLLETVRSAPQDRVLFSSAGRAISAGQIWATALEIAGRLPASSEIYLHTASASLFLAGLLAAAHKGRAVSFPAHLQPHYLREIGADKARILSDVLVEMPEAATIALAVADDARADISGASDLDLTFYTSGVTGLPKPVPKSMLDLEREARVLDEAWGASAGHVFATVSHQHIYGMLFRIFWPVLSGRIAEDRAADYWEQLAGKLNDDTTLVSSPAHLTRLPAVAGLTGASPRLIFSSSAPLPFAAAQAAHERLGSLPIEILGSTETGGIAWRQQHRQDAVWTPLPGVRVAADGGGQLSVTTPFAQTGNSIITGDLVEIVGDTFRVLGRGDRVVKIDGKRVALERVENALLALPWVAAAAAVDLPNHKGQLGAIVELNHEGMRALEAEGPFRLSRNLRAALAGRLEPSERPKRWRFESIPLDRQGKRVRAKLRDVFEHRSEDGLKCGEVLVHGPDHAEIAFALVPELIWFEGHFPGEPVLPGIAQVHLAVQWAERLWEWAPEGANLSRLKFRHVVRPGDQVRLTLQRNCTKKTLSFSYQLKQIIASEGMIGGDT